MQCERLLKLTKSWYIKVKDETMAPARMVAFMEQKEKKTRLMTMRSWTPMMTIWMMISMMRSE